MTPDELLTIHQTKPTQTAKHLSTLPQAALTTLLTSLQTNSELLKPLWTYPPLHKEILSLNPIPQHLIHHLQTLSHAAAPLKRRLQTISTTATTICKTRNYALLLPLLQSLSNLPGHSAVSMRGTLLGVFLAYAPADKHLVPPLIDLRLREHEFPAVVGFVMGVIEHTTPRDHTTLLAPLLTTKYPLAKPLLRVLSTANKESLIALQSTLLDDHTLPPYLSTNLSRAILTKSIHVTTSLLHTLFILTQYDVKTRDKVFDTLEKLLSGFHDYTPPAEGSSGTDAKGAVFVQAIRTIPIGCEQDVSDFLESLLWKSCRDVGVTLLEELFIWHPSSRTRVMKSLTAGLSTPASGVVHTAFMELLKGLVMKPTTAVGMRSCVGALKEALDYIFVMPVGVDALFVGYLARVMATVPATSDRLMMFLRKVAGARAVREQRVACRGLIAVLCVDAGEELFKDACEMLVRLIHADVVEFLVGLLLDAVEGNSVPVGRIEPILKAVTERVGVVLDNGGMDICRYFELQGGEYRLRNPVPLMLRFCITARGGAMDPFLGKFVKYICDEQGAIKHACSLERSSVPMVQRLRLLCNLLETMLGLGVVGSESVVRVYGVAIVLRDLFAVSAAGDDRSKQVGRYRKEEDEYLTMRQAATVNHVGGSLNEPQEGELLSLLALRMHALSELEKINACNVPALVNMARAEILGRLETDLRLLLALKEVSISRTHVDNLLLLVRKFFEISSSWTSSHLAVEEADTTIVRKKGDEHVNEPDKAAKDGSLAFVSTLGLDADELKTFEEASLVRLQEETRVRMRQSSLGILCMMLSRQLVRNDVDFLMDLTEGEPVTEYDSDKNNEGTKRQKLTRRTSTSPTESQEDKRVQVVSRITKMFRREFANSLSISLTLSYLSLLEHQACKGCKKSEDTTKLRKLVSNTLTSLLKEYSIRHQSVLRSMLKLLTITFDSVCGIDFAKSVLVWLGNNPCLLNSKFVESDEGSNPKLGVDEFDRDILEEAIALDAGEESEEEETSDLFNHDIPIGDTVRNAVQDSTDQDNRDQNFLESTPRMISDDTDPVKSLCLDETPEVALLSVTSVLELCGLVLGKDTQRYREALKSTSPSSSADAEFVAERVCDVVQEFCDTPFMQSFSSKSQAIPALLLKRLSGIVRRLLEIAQLLFQLLLKKFRNKSQGDSTKRHIQAANSILNMLYEGDSSEAILSAVLQGERRSNRSSLQEGVNVSAAELFRYVSSKDCDLDKDTRESVSKLRKVLKSRKNRLPHVHSVRTPWTQSSGSEEPSGDYFRVSRPQKRQRLRSRNPDVDDWLREEKDGDNYADLEDFVVAMDADEL